jgi:hypothetical protein
MESEMVEQAQPKVPRLGKFSGLLARPQGGGVYAAKP